MEIKFTQVQEAALSLIHSDLRFLYTVIKNIKFDESNYIPSLQPYMGVMIDGIEDWRNMAEIGGKYVDIMGAVNEYTVDSSIKFDTRDYDGFQKSPVGNKFSDKFVLFSILCQINFLLYGIEYWVKDETPTKLRFMYLLYYSLLELIPQINRKLNTKFRINSLWNSREFRNAMAHQLYEYLQLKGNKNI